MLTDAQIRLYRKEWALCRAALRRYGRSPSEADAERMRIHEQVCGTAKSSKCLTNQQLDKVLAIFWSWSKSDDLDAQIRQDNQPAIRCRGICRHLLDLFSEIDTDLYIAEDRKDAYIDGLFSRLNPGCPQDPDWAGFDPWHRVMSALTYRYDQLVRKTLGTAGTTDRSGKKAGSKRRLQYHPDSHDEHMQRIHAHQAFLTARCNRERELIGAGHIIDEGDPF